MSSRVCMLLLSVVVLTNASFAGGNIFFDTQSLSVVENASDNTLSLGLDYEGEVGVAGLQFKLIASSKAIRFVRAECGIEIADQRLWGFDFAVKPTGDTITVVLWARQLNSLKSGKIPAIVGIRFQSSDFVDDRTESHCTLEGIGSALADGLGNSAGIGGDGRALTIRLQPLPKQIEIQNYPNPFNPSTTIAYKLPQSGMTTLKIFNLIGKEIATLVNREMKAGNYEIQFDATGLASGVYFYRLTTENYSEIKRMTLVK